MKPRMVLSAQPPHGQWVVILIMMGVNGNDPANFARFLVKLARFHRSLHSEMCFILAGIGTTPIRLASVSFEHRFCYAS